MEPIIHYLIPTIFLIVLFPKINKKLVMSLAVLTWVIDIDFFTPWHRALTHNLFFMILIKWRNQFYNKSKWTHTAIIVGVGDKNLQVAEALSSGFVIRDWWIPWMENEIKAANDGIIKKVSVEVMNSVEKNELLLEFE